MSCSLQSFAGAQSHFEVSQIGGFIVKLPLFLRVIALPIAIALWMLGWIMTRVGED